MRCLYQTIQWKPQARYSCFSVVAGLEQHDLTCFWYKSGQLSTVIIGAQT
jgi:hypothetical protein